MAIFKKNKTYSELTVHDFRSTFRLWAADVSNYPKELVKAVSAHVLGNQTEVTYQRGDLLEKRRKMMNTWASYCLNGDT